MYRLFSWEHSYFSGKVRAYLRFKNQQNDLGTGYEDILATPELIAGLLTPKSGSGAVPQLETPDGEWIQDSSSIIDHCEAAHSKFPVIPDLKTRPRQRLVAYLIELLADEWTVVPAFWQRWFFSENGREPSHRLFNEQQWGAVMNPNGQGAERRAAGAGFFDEMWPALGESMRTLVRFLESPDHTESGEVPGKTFTATPGFLDHQTGTGGLTHPFTIGGIESRRMVVPYQAWMLQRINDAFPESAEHPARATLATFLENFAAGPSLLDLDVHLQGWRIRKDGALLFADKN